MFHTSYFDIAEARSWWRLESKNFNVRPLEVDDLFTSCYMGHIKILNEILRNRQQFTIFAVDSYGQSALHYAAAASYTNIVQLLIEKRLNIEQETFQSLTPLDYAVVSNLNNTKVLLENGARITDHIEMLLINNGVKCKEIVSLLLLYYVKRTGGKYNEKGNYLKQIYAKEFEIIDLLKRSYVNVEMAAAHTQISYFNFLFMSESDFITFSITSTQFCDYNQYYTMLLTEKCKLVKHTQNMFFITELLKNL